MYQTHQLEPACNATSVSAGTCVDNALIEADGRTMPPWSYNQAVHLAGIGAQSFDVAGSTQA